MKRTTIIVTTAILLITGAFLAAAEGKGWFEKSKAEKGKPMIGLCPMHMMMCEHMMKKEIIATEDGGVIIMACGKLYKYDKDLNLVKDVELTKIKEDMKAKMEEIKKECAEKCKMKKVTKETSGIKGKEEKSGAEEIEEDVEM
jgi:hypothetical protein